MSPAFICLCHCSRGTVGLLDGMMVSISMHSLTIINPAIFLFHGPALSEEADRELAPITDMSLNVPLK